jgi:hypothetical protein
VKEEAAGGPIRVGQRKRSSRWDTPYERGESPVVGLQLPAPVRAALPGLGAALPGIMLPRAFVSTAAAISAAATASVEAAAAARRGATTTATGPVRSTRLRVEALARNTNPAGVTGVNLLGDLRDELRQRHNVREQLAKSRGAAPVPSNVPELGESRALSAYLRCKPMDYLKYASEAHLRENERVFVGVDWNAQRNHEREAVRRLRDIKCSLLEVYNCSGPDDVELLCVTHGVPAKDHSLVRSWWSNERFRTLSLIECPHCQRLFHLA